MIAFEPLFLQSQILLYVTSSVSLPTSTTWRQKPSSTLFSILIFLFLIPFLSNLLFEYLTLFCILFHHSYSYSDLGFAWSHWSPRKTSRCWVGSDRSRRKQRWVTLRVGLLDWLQIWLLQYHSTRRSNSCRNRRNNSSDVVAILTRTTTC